MARNSLLCADVPLRNYSLTHSLQLSTELAVYKAVVLTTLTHGCELGLHYYHALIAFTCGKLRCLRQFVLKAGGNSQHTCGLL